MGNPGSRQPVRGVGLAQGTLSRGGCWRTSPLNPARGTWPRLEAPASTVGLVQQGRASGWGWMASILTPAAVSSSFWSPILPMGVGRGGGLARPSAREAGSVWPAPPSSNTKNRTSGFYKLTFPTSTFDDRYFLPWFSNFSILKILKP